MNARVLNPVLLALLLVFPCALFAQEMALEYHGAGWVQFGKVESSYMSPDPGADLKDDYNKNWMQSTGGQLDLTAKMDSNWDAGLALGVVGVHLPRGGMSVASYWYPFWVPYVGEARISYSHPGFSSGKFRLTLGSFSYDYSPDAKNLGLYLMRGYVYPGAVESGFGGIFGGMAHYEQAGFGNDLILKSEDERPSYDLSLADVVSYQILPGLEIGAGVNFYRLVSQTDCSPGGYGLCSIQDTVKADTGIVRDSITGNVKIDSITGSLSGTKLMGRFHMDPKALFGFSSLGSLALGKQDLILYGEAAILGLTNYPLVYDDMLRRIPVMVGFNFPVFGYLDYLSLEVEYYASKNSSDNVGANWGGGWVPLQENDPSGKNDPDLRYYKKRDDWKWSVNASRVLFGHMQLSAQVADDHLRPGGWHDSPWVGKEAFRTPKDWYWTCKLAYFF